MMNLTWLGMGKKKDVVADTMSVPNRGGWATIFEPFTGAWQRNIEWRRESVLAYHAIFACTTLIASDISKLRIRLVREANGIWSEIPFGDYDVLRKPNTMQNRIQFFENWINSKLTRGNTYIIKGRDRNRKVKTLHILNPDLVEVLVSTDGEIFYQLSQDNLSGIEEGFITVPASEIIHDRFNCLFHPLVGLSPIFACGLAAYQGLKIQENSARFFKNQSRPSGILSAPGAISNETAERLKQHWETNYSGDNTGKVAVLGDALKYEALAVNAVDSQMVEQLKLSADIVCSTYHVPSYKVIGTAPSFNNIEALEQQYYSQCLQTLIESIELLLDEGLEIEDSKGTEFDLDGLLRMDSSTHIKTLKEAVIGGIMAPNEARKSLNMVSVEGGDTPFLQEQNWPINLLSNRSPKGLIEQSSEEVQPIDDEKLLEFSDMIKKELAVQ